MTVTAYLVDLASYQHGINLTALRSAGFTRVNIKLTQGLNYVNPDIEEFVSGARANGLEICTFHWLDGQSSGFAQAQAALAQMDKFGLRWGTAHQVDCEDTQYPATFAIWRDYVNAMQNALGRHVISYTGDWWWSAHMGGNNGAALTPYLWAAPNHGYDYAYPGDSSGEWSAGYGGWGTYSALQYAVGPLAGVGGGDLSKTAFRDPKVWQALTGVDAASITVDEGDTDVQFLALGGTQYYLCDGFKSQKISAEDANVLAYLAIETSGAALKLGRSVDGNDNAEWTHSPNGTIHGVVRMGWVPSFGQIVDGPLPAPVDPASVVLTQDQINAAVAANVPALAVALAQHIKIS